MLRSSMQLSTGFFFLMQDEQVAQFFQLTINKKRVKQQVSPSPVISSSGDGPVSRSLVLHARFLGFFPPSEKKKNSLSSTCGQV